MSFISNTELKTELTSVLKQAGADTVGSHWDALVARSNTAAYQEILRRLVPRGYTKAQVDTWVSGAEFQTDIGLFWCLTKNATQSEFPDTFIAKLDRREELDTVALLDSSGVEIPPLTASDEVAWGTAETGSDMFVMPTSNDDDRIGEVTEW